MNKILLLFVFDSQKSETLSEVAMANVEALAADDVVESCGGCSTYFLGRKCCTLVFEGKKLFCIMKINTFVEAFL